MTDRVRSRLRFGALFTASTLVVMALGLLMVRGAYDSAYADGAAAVATSPPAIAALDAGVPDGIATSPVTVSATAPPVASPPSIDDAVTAYRAGQWTALALAAFAVLFVGIRKVAKARGSVWLGAFASYLAGVGAVVATGIAYAVKVGGLDPAVIGAAIMAVAAVIYRLPDDVPIAPPRNSEAGYVARHLNLVISIGLALLLAVPFAASCSSPAARGLGGSLRQEIVDCGRAEVHDLAADLVPAVTAIVTGDTPSWREQLDALLHAGTHAGACAIKAVGGDLAARAAAVVTGAHAEGQERIGAEHAREYLAARGFVFEVR